jgi:hypothetical protein
VHRSVVAAAVAVVALVAGGSAAWAWDARTQAAADDESRARVAAAVTAGQHDEQSVSRLTDRVAGSAASGLLDDSHTALAGLVQQAQLVLDGSAGQVADDAVRQRLAAALAAAQAGLAAGVASSEVDALAGALSSATDAVTQAQADWSAAQASASARASAEASASARAAAASASAAAAGTGASCRTTYDGPTFWTSVPTADGDGTNGNIPASAMAPLSWSADSQGHRYWLVTGAAAALEQLNVAFRAQFGHDLDIDLAYRDLATQQEMYDALGPKIAARPGTSNHGLGKAIDVPEWPCEYGLDTPERDWLVAHGPQYGWVASTSEYWHYDFTR